MNLIGIDISIDSSAVSILRKNGTLDDLIISNFTTLKGIMDGLKKPWT